ncbi:MAG: EAL domain-containing protein, partial [Rhodomicrobium sp.]|nr:EAL domain-containing protein [Rhodomicrobium sp.]
STRLWSAGTSTFALTERQFEVYYQPVVRLSDRSVAGMEALLRWRHPSRGLLGPDAFREAFDDAKLMAAIGETVMGLVIPDAARFRQAHGHGLRIAMNVTASDLITGDYLDRLQRRLQAHGLSGDALCIEITEDVFLGRSKETAMETIASLANSGFEIALDDFGTGYASLSHLRLVPVHKLKIDSSFITDMERDPGDLAIVRTIAHLGESLGLDIVAEGVETDSQADLLRLLGVAAMQGYLISQPMPFEEALAFLKAQQSPLTKKPVTVLRA